MTSAASLSGRVCSRLEAQLALAEEAVAADPGVSPVAAVLAEFRRKFAKTRATIEDESHSAWREAVVELEQAADSAKWAATADRGAAATTRDAIVAAHDTICHFKSTGELLPEA